MFLVGLTGGIASGKSSVIQVFQQLGCAVIDIDVIARQVVQPGHPAHRRIVEAFGTEVLLENGDINRKVLGDLIFNQPDRRSLLNAITHPEIRKQMMKETFKYFLRGKTQGLGQGWGRALSPQDQGPGTGWGRALSRQDQGPSSLQKVWPGWGSWLSRLSSSLWSLAPTMQTPYQPQRNEAVSLKS
ncbi:dephospho-CoA kinase domain-containing protein isoform X2 [Equus przewalskii]|uniref:Dephospho-CoA kinase domain-containing protein isoform X2 n=1 Tax=Equus przewalskii TaxID=9798 RepID=A0ABM4JKE9_EQUPR